MNAPANTTRAPRIAYLRNSKKHPVACLAYTIVGSSLFYGLSLCHERDRGNWNRDLAKRIASGRLAKELRSPSVGTTLLVRGCIEIGPKDPNETIPASLRALDALTLSHGYDALVGRAIEDHERKVARRQILDALGTGEVASKTQDLIDSILRENERLRLAQG